MQKGKCIYCGDPIKKGVKAGDGKKEIIACSWRHLHKYLISVFVEKGSQHEEGLE